MSDKAFSLRMSSELHTLSNIVAKHLNVSKNEVLCGLLEEWTIQKIHEIIQKPYSGDVHDLEEALSGLLEIRQARREEELKQDEFIETFRHSLNRIKQEKQDEQNIREPVIKSVLSKYETYFENSSFKQDISALAQKMRTILSPDDIQAVYQVWVDNIFIPDLNQLANQVHNALIDRLYNKNKSGLDSILEDSDSIEIRHKILFPTCIAIVAIVFDEKRKQN